MYNLVIADDEQLVFQYIQAVIEKNHLPLHICGTASNGKEALRLVQIYQPEFVMLDINMPELMDWTLPRKYAKPIQTHLFIF